MALLAAGGWSQCHQELYSNALDNTQVDEIQDTCHGEKVFLGCRKVGDDHLTVAAWGRKATVFTNVTDEVRNCRKNCNSKKEAGTQWYRTPAAWGFAAQDNDLYLSYLDVGDTHEPAPKKGTAETRLSWFMNVSNTGGYRCGAFIIGLFESNAWETVFFHAN